MAKKLWVCHGPSSPHPLWQSVLCWSIWNQPSAHLKFRSRHIRTGKLLLPGQRGGSSSCCLCMDTFVSANFEIIFSFWNKERFSGLFPFSLGCQNRVQSCSCLYVTRGCKEHEVLNSKNPTGHVKSCKIWWEEADSVASRSRLPTELIWDCPFVYLRAQSDRLIAISVAIRTFMHWFGLQGIRNEERRHNHCAQVITPRSQLHCVFFVALRFHDLSVLKIKIVLLLCGLQLQWSEK